MVLNPKEDVSGTSDAWSTVDHSAIEQLYTLDKVVGVGGFAQVVRAVNRANGKTVAIKMILVPEGPEADAVEANIQQEISIMGKCAHRNVLKLYNAYRQGQVYYLISEFCAGGELLSQVIDEPFGELEARRVVWEVAKGLRHIHAQGVVHRDLKLENILVKDKRNRTGVKICDFGLAVRMFARKEHLTTSHATGSILYVAPEIVSCSDEAERRERASMEGGGSREMLEAPPTRWYDERCDMWSLGVCTYILLFRQPPFGLDEDGDYLDNEETLSQIRRGRFSFPAGRGFSQEACDLIRQLLQPVPDHRLSIEEIFDHPWIAPLLAEEAGERLKDSRVTGQERVGATLRMQRRFGSETGMPTPRGAPHPRSRAARASEDVRSGRPGAVASEDVRPGRPRRSDGDSWLRGASPPLPHMRRPQTSYQQPQPPRGQGARRGGRTPRPSFEREGRVVFPPLSPSPTA